MYVFTMVSSHYYYILNFLFSSKFDEFDPKRLP